MRKKSIMIVACSLVLVLVLALGVTSAFASSAADKPEGPGMFGGPGGPFGKGGLDFGTPPEEGLAEMDEEMAAEMAARREEMEAQMRAQMEEKQAQWDALSETDKEEILGLQRQMLQVQQQLIDKYLALGLIEADVAEMMQEHISEMLKNLDEGTMAPAIGRPGGGFGQRGRMDFPGLREEGTR